METWISNRLMGVCAAWVLISYRNIGACLLFADQHWRHVCAGWVLISNEDMVCACWPQIHNGHNVCWVGAQQSLKHGCVLVGCCSGMETCVRAGLRTGDMSMCYVVAEQQCNHGGRMLRNNAKHG